MDNIGWDMGDNPITIVEINKINSILVITHFPIGSSKIVT